jgi:hypothetical protein
MMVLLAVCRGRDVVSVVRMFFVHSQATYTKERTSAAQDAL